MAKNNEKSRPAYNQSYEIIRDMILQGDIPRGTKIVEEKLASELGVAGPLYGNPYVNWSKKDL